MQKYNKLCKHPNIFRRKKEKILARTRTYYVLYKRYSMYIYILYSIIVFENFLCKLLIDRYLQF